MLKTEAIKFEKELPSLAKDEKLPKNLMAFLDTAYVKKQPYGVVLILGKTMLLEMHII